MEEDVGSTVAGGGGRRLGAGRAAWEQRGFCKLPCLHHRHPENKCKQ